MGMPSSRFTCSTNLLPPYVFAITKREMVISASRHNLPYKPLTHGNKASSGMIDVI